MTTQREIQKLAILRLIESSGQRSITRLFVLDFMAKHGWTRQAGETDLDAARRFFDDAVMVAELDAHCQLMVMDGAGAVRAAFNESGVKTICPKAWLAVARQIVEALNVSCCV